MQVGDQLRAVRERLGLTLRDVEAASNRLAAKYQIPQFAISLSRLSDLETKSIVPTIYKFYSLAVIYGEDVRDLFALYGVLVNNAAADIALIERPATQKVKTIDFTQKVEMPVRVDPAFDIHTSTALGRMILKWGTVPMAYLEGFSTRKYTYAYVGVNDRTMYPLIMPGSLLQVDESKRKIGEGPWRSEYERPIYFVETREGFTCAWCQQEGTTVALIPHPMSNQKARMLRAGIEVDIIGQIVGVAMRLEETQDESAARQ